MRGMRLRSLSGLCLVSLTLGTVVSACGSSDGKKKAQDPHRYSPDGGDGGEPSSTAGKPGTANVGGAPGASGESGVAGQPPISMAGAAGVDQCPLGFGDCDDNPDDCETKLNTVTACGACDVSCDGSHGSVSCVQEKCSIASCTAGYDNCDDDANTGCEAKLDTDTRCGSCTRNCAAAGATCATGMCSVVELSPNGQAYQAAFGGGAVFVMKVNAQPVSHYTLTRIPLDGSAEKTIWDAAGGVGVRVMYADATDLYWAVGGNPSSVLKKAATAAPGDLPTVLFQPTGLPNFLTIRGNAFFWMTGLGGGVSTLFTRATNAAQAVTGTEIMNVDQHYVSAFTTTTDSAYWVARNLGAAVLTTVPLGGGAPTAVPDSVVVDSAPLYAVGDTLYFVRTGNANVLNGIYRFKTGDATVTQLVQQEGVNSLIVDDTGVYYRAGYVDRILYKAKLTGGAGVPIAKVQGGLAGFAGQDATLLYTYNSWDTPGSAYKIVK